MEIAALLQILYQSKYDTSIVRLYENRKCCNQLSLANQMLGKMHVVWRMLFKLSANVKMKNEK